MQDEIYIKGPVLSPGATGWPGMTQDRPLSAKEIQKAAYQFLPGYSIIDVQHSFMKQAEVVESYVSPEQTEFNGKIYPEGTWFVTSRVTSPEIIKAVEDGELTGYSIGAFPEKQYKELKRINKSMFNDVEEGAWFPLAISIVDVPFYPEMVFKLFGPDDFIKKEQIVEDKIMSEDKTRDTLLEKIFDYFIKKEEVKEPVEGSEDVAPEFITKSELDDFKVELIEMLKSDDEDEEDEEVEDAGEDEEEPEEVDAPAGEPITKSLPVDQPPVVKESFNKQLGRDAFGNKIE